MSCNNNPTPLPNFCCGGISYNKGIKWSNFTTEYLKERELMAVDEEDYEVAAEIRDEIINRYSIENKIAL